MKVEVRGINGETVSYTFGEDSKGTMREVYLAVAERAKVGIDDIKIFSLRTGERYDMLEPLVNVCRKEKGLVGYQVLFKKPKEARIAKPSARVSEMLKQKENIRFRCRMEYRDYARIARQRPPDFEQRVASLCELGFDKGDCASALRMCRYDIQTASVLLTDKNWTRHLINDRGFVPFFDGFGDIDDEFVEMERFERIARRLEFYAAMENEEEREMEETQTETSETDANPGRLQSGRFRRSDPRFVFGRGEHGLRWHRPRRGNGEH